MYKKKNYNYSNVRYYMKGNTLVFSVGGPTYIVTWFNPSLSTDDSQRICARTLYVCLRDKMEVKEQMRRWVGIAVKEGWFSEKNFLLGKLSL
jgi:hypothetical protein